MRRLTPGSRRLALLFSFLLPLMVACGDDEGPTDPGDPPPLEVLPPDPDGMLLAGADTDDARAATVALAPSPAPADEIDGSLLTTRLAAVIAPGATVAAVKAALAAQGAAIVSMMEGDPYVVLIIEAVEDRAEAEARAAALMATGAFVYARPGYMSSRPLVVEKLAKRDFPEESSLSHVPHLLPARVPAAWNLRRAASGGATLVVPDWYADIPSYIEVPQLTFAENAGRHLVPADGPIYRGGILGYHRLGVAAADWDYDSGISPHTGVDPVAKTLLDVTGIDTYGLDDAEIIEALALEIPAGELTVVLSVETFDDPDGIFFRFLDRAWLALRWRILVHGLLGGPGFVHVVAAGNSGEAEGAVNEAAFNSTYGIATAANLSFVASLDADEDELATFQASYEAAVAQQAAIGEPLANVLLVGSSDANGNESSFSTPLSQVRMVGEGVVGPCLVGDECEGVSTALSETGAAAAQVAGLSAYLWHLDPLRSVPELLLLLQHAYSASGQPGILDASIATLGLDHNAGDLLRKTLLDVSGPAAVPDGLFTEDDIDEFLAAFEAFEGASEPDWSVYDLNGDGWTAGPGRARLDLDVNDLPGFTTVEQVIGGETVSFDEMDVTDEEVLCYYAYSPLYTGSTSIRDELLGGHCGGGDAVLPGARMTSEIGLAIEGDISGDYDYAEGSDLVFIPDFGDYVTALDSTIALGGLTASTDAHSTASLHREPGGTVTLAVDLLVAASVQWPAEGDYASASGGSQCHLGLEITGEHTVTVSGRLRVDAPSLDASAGTYLRVGPDSTLAGWSFPGGGSWRLNYYDVDVGFLDIEAETATIPDGVHRLWVNLRGEAAAGDDSNNISSGSNDGTAAVEDLLVTLTPADAARARVRVMTRQGGVARSPD